VPEVSFNYLGQLGQALVVNNRFGAAPESGGPDRGLSNVRQYVLEFSGGLDENQLQITWTYSEDLHRRETIERLTGASVAALRALSATADAGEGEAVAPSDFPLTKLDQKQLGKVLKRIKDKA
jgi:non-ribosomal peptide synthase protein (TIGR01720 family)